MKQLLLLLLLLPFAGQSQPVGTKRGAGSLSEISYMPSNALDSLAIWYARTYNRNENTVQVPLWWMDMALDDIVQISKERDSLRNKAEDLWQESWILRQQQEYISGLREQNRGLLKLIESYKKEVAIYEKIHLLALGMAMGGPIPKPMVHKTAKRR